MAKTETRDTKTMLLKRACIRLIPLLLVGQVAIGQSTQPDLINMNIEDLMNLKVTSVSKKAERVSHTAAAVFVITREDIRQSAATNLPDLLRAVPGLQVAQINASAWAISARGLNEHFSDKLMVMLDGRSAYSSTFSGVYWDGLDVPLEDIERIEIIRGPGGSAWGSNAVNGAINIITRSAADTHGGVLVAGGGNVDQGFGTLQYGGTLKSGTDYRIFTKYFNNARLTGLAGPNGEDQWNVARAGFRADHKLSSRDDLTVLGDLYAGHQRQIIPRFGSITSPDLTPTAVAPGLSGGYIQTSWDRLYTSGGDTKLQVSFDRYHRGGLLEETRDTVDVDFQHHFAFKSRQDIVWGLGYSNTKADITGNFTVSMSAPDLDTQLFSGFIQDEIAVVPNRLSLTIGTKFEHNYYTGFGVMPSGRLAWNLRDHHMAWASISRGVRTPATFDTSIVANIGGVIDPSGTPVLFRLLGNRAARNEQLLAYELGYRRTISSRLSLDFAGYYNSYDHLITTEPTAAFLEDTPSPSHIVMPITVANLMYGETHGLETFATWKATRRWTLIPAFSIEEMHLHVDPASGDTQSVGNKQGSTPRHWSRLDSRLDLGHGLEWNINAAFVDRLPAQGIPAYTRVDSKLALKLHHGLVFEVVGQNLLKDNHPEFIDLWGALNSSQVRRNVFAKVTWRFNE